jgi:transposase InsO family protein
MPSVYHGIEAFFPRKDAPLLRDDARLRKRAAALPLSRDARMRLGWMLHWKKTRNASATARHFGISRRTFLTWKTRFDEQDLSTLEDRSRAPAHVRTWQVTPEEEARILVLKHAHPAWGKAKIQVLYRKAHGGTISQWKIQRVTTRHQCFPEPARVEKRARKRQRSRAKGVKKRIQELALKEEPHFLWQLDTVVRYIDGMKRYIFTAVDHVAKLGFARMYPTKSSQNAADFLRRLQFLTAGHIVNLQTDNGSEFAGMFEDAARALGLAQYFSRVRTPKDNAVNERFNETLTYEFLRFGNLDADVARFNAKLAPWLLEYNTVRPHQTLTYLTPLEFLGKHKVGRMWSSTTRACPQHGSGVSRTGISPHLSNPPSSIRREQVAASFIGRIGHLVLSVKT